MKKIIIIAAIAVVVIGGGLGAYFLFFANKGEADAEAEATPTPTYTYALENYYVTNVKDSNMLFKTTIVLVTTEAEMEDFLTANQYIIRDTILFRLRELTEEDIKALDIQDRLRAEIPVILNKALNIDTIVSVYFSDFVMQ
jgi:flagellar FliL protein